jgi:hypothetical protein
LLVAALAAGSVLAGVWTSPEPVKPPPPTADELIDAYPGDDASPREKALWMGRAARASGIPPELPVMAAISESGLTNGRLGRGSYGYFGLRRDIWNHGAYKGFFERPALQLRWFINQAIAVRDSGVQRGVNYSSSDKGYGDWVADIERPTAYLRSQYGRALDLARTLLAR